MIMSDVNPATLEEMGRARRRGRHLVQALHRLPGRALQRRRPDPAGHAAGPRPRRAGLACTPRTASPSTCSSSRRSPAASSAPRYHAATRPEVSEAEATHRALCLAEMAGAPVYIVHLTAARALEEVMRFRDRGLPVYAETCPQYLFCSADDLARAGLRGRQVRLQPADAAARHAGGSLARPAHRPPAGRGDRPLPVRLRRAEGDGPRGLHQDPQRHARHRDAPAAPLGRRRARAAASAPAASSR